MNSRDRLWVTALIAGGALIWTRDPRWLAEADDVLPALVALPLAVWLGAPWRLNAPTRPPARFLVLLSAAAALLGAATNMTLFLAAGWTGLLWVWLERRLPHTAIPRARRLLILPFNAFPWVTLDLQPVGWWFRLTGAQVTETAFRAFGFDITREGTQLVIQGVPVSVDAACAGLHAFQSMLIAGSLLAFILLGSSRYYWWNIGLLPALAWCANTVRILAITGASLTWGQEFAMGLFHTWGGLLVLVCMFAGCGALFRWQALHLVRPTPAHP